MFKKILLIISFTLIKFNAFSQSHIVSKDTLSEVEIVGKQKMLKTSNLNLFKKSYLLPNPFSNIKIFELQLKGIRGLDSAKNIMLHISDKVNESIYISDIKLRANIAELSYLDSIKYYIVLTSNNSEIDTIIELYPKSLKFNNNKLSINFNQQIFVNKYFDGFYLLIKDISETLNTIDNSGLILYLTNSKYPQLTYKVINEVVIPFNIKNYFVNNELSNIKENDIYNLECEINYLAR